VNSILDSVLEHQEQLQTEDGDDFDNALQVAIDRNARLNQFMANFADVIRTPPPQKTVQDLHATIRHVATLMTRACEARKITLTTHLAEAPFLVNIDNQQMEQVLVNIIKNALEAIDDAGWIEITTHDATPKTLRIRNNGRPIPPDVQAHLFTPFYTTKQGGQGIGLTLTQEILRNHGFRFSLETNTDRITTFMISFG
jgi:signal transduction histidine kinase